jgi:hypothetical protein
MGLVELPATRRFLSLAPSTTLTSGIRITNFLLNLTLRSLLLHSQHDTNVQARSMLIKVWTRFKINKVLEKQNKK